MVQANSKDIDMQFGIQKWEIVEEGYKYLEFTEAQKNKEQKMKEIFQIEYLKGTRLALQSKLNCRNKIKAIITWAVSLMRYGEGKIGWKKNEPQNLERRTRKLVTICIKLNPESDVSMLYVFRICVVLNVSFKSSKDFDFATLI